MQEVALAWPEHLPEVEVVIRPKLIPNVDVEREQVDGCGCPSAQDFKESWQSMPLRFR